MIVALQSARARREHTPAYTLETTKNLTQLGR